VGQGEYRLTKDAILDATSAVGLTTSYAARCPAELVAMNLDYWYRHGERELKLLARGGDGLGFAKGSVVPFSNLGLMDAALGAIERRYGAGPVHVDYKLAHSLRLTRLRLIVPESQRAVREGDLWSAGIQIQNSLIGDEPTVLNGYLFRFWCTNGAISVAASSGNYSRRGGGEDVYEWARRAVDEILGGLESEFTSLEALTRIPVDGDVEAAIGELGLRLPRGFSRQIGEAFRRSSARTMYDLMNAITQAANAPEVGEQARQALMTVGGRLPRAVAERCPQCHRPMNGHGGPVGRH
jgi:hypothetical protein